MSDLRERARGRWRGILPSLGIGGEYLSGKHSACPICRNGKDRFRFDDKDGVGTWICSHCGAGDGIKLVMEIHGWTFREAAIEIEKFVGSAPYAAPKKARSIDKKLRDMNAVWNQSTPVQHGDVVVRYLSARCGQASIPECLRTAERLRYFDDNGPSWHPAMVAMVTGPDGKPINVHRTFLAPAGGKAAVGCPRRIMPGEIPHGSAIRLYPHAGVLGVAEGIETALSARALFGTPTWALISKPIMSKWIVPSDVRELVIFADNDANFAGHAAAYELAHRARMAAPGGLIVSVRAPPIADTDWNDFHQQKLALAA